MQITRHAAQRMRQRGITGAMVSLVQEFGEIDHDRLVLDRKGALRALEELETKVRVARKILDKGGVVVVESGAAVVTTFNRNSKS